MKRLLLLPLFAALAACSQSTDLGGDLFGQYKYTVLSKNSVIADGFTNLTVSLKVEDFFGQPVKGFKPLLTPGVGSSSAGVNFFDCQSSDEGGVSTCKFRSLYEGPKKFTISDSSDKGDQAVEILFVPSPERKGQIFGVIPSAQPFSSTSNGDVISSTVGNMVSNPRQRMNNNQWLFRADISIKY